MSPSHDADENRPPSQVTLICAAVYFLLLLSLYWGQGVCRGVSDVTAAGAIGAWVFVPETVEAPAPCVGLLKPVVSNALLRAMTTCFGSICFGTLVVAVVSALVETLKQLKYKRMSNCVPLGLPLKLVNCCIDCVLDAIKRAVEVFNEWALVYTGLYGRSFLASGRAVIGLAQEKISSRVCARPVHHGAHDVPVGWSRRRAWTSPPTSCS